MNLSRKNSSPRDGEWEDGAILETAWQQRKASAIPDLAMREEFGESREGSGSRAQLAIMAIRQPTSYPKARFPGKMQAW
jgi:hypothetical protein